MKTSPANVHSSPIRAIVLGPILLSMLFVASCGDDRSGDGNTSAEGGASRVPARQLTDSYGGTLSTERPVQRIVSFAPNMTEIVCFLGARDRLVGRTDFCNYPPDVAAVPSIGTLNSYNYEKIVTLRPDVVLMSTFDGTSRKEYDKLAGLGVHPFALAGQSIEGTIDMIDTVAMLLGAFPESRVRTDSLRGIVDSIRNLVSGRTRVRTFIVLNKAPLVTASKGFIHEVLTAAGGDNIAAGDPIAYPEYSRELLVRQNPDVILIPAPSDEIIGELLETYPEWRELKAVREGRLYTIDQDLIARPGPRIVEGLTEVYRLLHVQ